VTNFNEKFNEAKNQLSEKMGINPVEVSVPIVKSMKNSDVIPVNVKWNDTRIRQITDKKPTYEKKVMVPNKIKTEE